LERGTNQILLFYFMDSWIDLVSNWPQKAGVSFFMDLSTALSSDEL
jgi:hypothetical protein